MSGRSSGAIRGKQISQYVGGNFFDYSKVNVDTLNKIVIFIRQKPPENFIKFLKSRGHIIGYDILDSPAGDFHFRNKIYNDMSPYTDDEFIDFYIVNNSFMKEEVKKISSKLIYTIPHHTVNFSNQRFSNGEGFKRIGYVGLPEQSGAIKKIKNISNNAGCKFSIYNPKNPEECISAFKEIDIGIVYIDPDDKRLEYILKFKPNTKLTNFQSFGIPTICSPYASFIEFGNNSCIFSNSDEKTRMAINTLISNKKLRKKISDHGYENSQRFLIKNIVEKKYGEIVKDFREIKK